MATKTQIQNAINTIDDGGLNTAAEMRSVLELIKNAMYPDITLDTQATTNVFTQFGSTFNYTLRVFKVGNLVSVNGSIENVSGSIVSNVKVADITTSEYLPNGKGYQSNFDGVTFRIDDTDNALTLISSLGIGESQYVAITYKTVD